MAGEIRHLKRYRQLYDHSPWYGVLPNNITPSDIDVVFDFKLRARMLFCEFTCDPKVKTWGDKEFGQRLMYQQLLRTNNYNNACAICLHNIDADKQINTMNDVLSFHVMRIFNRDGVVRMMPNDKQPYDGSKWVDFVKCFYGIDNALGDW